MIINLIIDSHEDFTHTLSFADSIGGQFLIRELTPKDFYWVALEEQREDFADLPMAFMVSLIDRLTIRSDYNSITELPLKRFRKIDDWVQTDVLHGNLMRVEDWLYYAYHLMGRTWGSDLEYLESLPVPKINQMISIQADYNSQSKSQSPMTK